LKIFYRSPFLKWPPQYHTNSTLSDFNTISYVGRLWCPEMIPDIEKFLPVVILKMAATIPHKFNIVRFQRHYSNNVEFLRSFWKCQCQESIQDVEIEQCWICAVLWRPFWKWRPVEICLCQESFRDIIIYPHMKCRWNRTMLNRLSVADLGDFIIVRL
jgi:hypothetical protein